MNAKLIMISTALLAVLAIVVWAATTSAAPMTATDHAYVAALNAEGMYFDDDGAAAIKAGHQIAAVLQANPEFATIDAIVLTALENGLSDHAAATVILNAVAYYAPAQLPLLKAWTYSHTTSTYVI